MTTLLNTLKIKKTYLQKSTMTSGNAYRITITRNKKHTIILGIQTEANLFFCNAFNFFSLLLGTL